MKKNSIILLAIFFFVPAIIKAQLTIRIHFDPLDTASYMYSYAMPWQEMIVIDTINYHNNTWQVGKPQKPIFNAAYSDPNVIVTDTIHPCIVSDTSVFILTVSDTEMHDYAAWMYNYGWFSGIDFKYKLNKDSESTAKIEFSHDSGATWIGIYDSSALLYFPYVLPIVPDTLWHTWSIGAYSFAFNPPFNDSIKFRFTFIRSSDTGSYAGWIIDDINLRYEYPEQVTNVTCSTLSAYPNPVKDELRILGLKQAAVYQLFSIEGVYICSGIIKPSEAMSMHDQPPGSYLLELVRDDNVKIVLRVMKE